MLKTLDFVDPLLAERIHNLERQMSRLETSRVDITKNKKLMPSIRQKLLTYQEECENNTRKMFQQQRDKLAQYLDKQIIVIKDDREITDTKSSTKFNSTSNQSTRIDFSIDQSKFTQNFNKPSNRSICQPSKQQKIFAKTNKNRQKINRLKKKVQQQQKLINMLVTWVKIYHEKQNLFESDRLKLIQKQNQELCNTNQQLMSRCQLLQKQLAGIRTQFQTVSQNILVTHRKFQSLSKQNKGLKMQRNQLLLKANSLKKNNKDIQTFV